MTPHTPSETVILLAEDDVIIRNLVRTMLSKKGYGVLTASDGSEALSVFEQVQAPINLLIADVIMPSMNGTELAEKIRELRPEVKIILMSGEMNGQIRAGNRLDAFLQKPFVPATLLKTIETVLGGDNKQFVRA